MEKNIDKIAPDLITSRSIFCIAYMEPEINKPAKKEFDIEPVLRLLAYLSIGAMCGLYLYVLMNII